MDDKPGSDGLPFAWLTQRLDSIERRMTEHHQGMRADMNVGFADLRRAFAEHEDEDRKVADRLLRVETERDVEKRTASQHGAVAGSITGGLVIGLVEGVKRLLGHP